MRLRIGCNPLRRVSLFSSQELFLANSKIGLRPLGGVQMQLQEQLSSKEMFKLRLDSYRTRIKRNAGLRNETHMTKTSPIKMRTKNKIITFAGICEGWVPDSATVVIQLGASTG
jgi:hypothetical protein